MFLAGCFSSFKILVDTGFSGFALVSQSYFNSAVANCEIFHPQVEKCENAVAFQFGVGAPQKSVKSAKARLGPYIFDVRIVSSSRVPLLLGLKFLKMLKFNIDCVSAVASNGVLQLPLKVTNLSEVKVLQQSEIEPYSSFLGCSDTQCSCAEAKFARPYLRQKGKRAIFHY